MIKKITHKQPKLLSQKVTELLREAIIYGELKPGEKLNEAQLAARLGISKSPLREALRNLESEGLVETRSWKGTIVKKATAKELEEVYLVLSMIEGTVSRLAAINMDSKKERELKSMLRELEICIEKEDIRKNVILSRKLHDFIIKSSENDLLARIHKSLRTQELRFSMVSQKGAASPLDVLREHIAISEALLERDEDKAGLLMVAHIKNARLRALARLEQNEDGTVLSDIGSNDGRE
jgi:DNA-binding GntR family transcriptional regulator